MPRSITLAERHPELFAQDQYIDPRSQKRLIPMEVLCLGYMRTGTASMQSAFNILGIPCSHSFSLFYHIRDCAMWNQAFDAKYAGKGKPFTRCEWDQLLAAYGAVTDVPALAFWEDLVSAYPEAKVVLMERDVDQWFKSFEEVVIKPIWSKWGNWIASREPRFVGPLRDVHLRWVKYWMGVHSAEEMRSLAKNKYREHYASVRKTVPKERLLEYRLGSGWEPLCTFLGKEVPDVEFPKVNETASMQEKMAIIARRGVKNLLKRALLFTRASKDSSRSDMAWAASKSICLDGEA
ncbi:hypothetical protein G7Y79_00070g096760 [Physcia stellaris]|nr:hypothetical protein G7Y79_00070g096760 [Physcia stellaris]